VNKIRIKDIFVFIFSTLTYTLLFFFWENLINFNPSENIRKITILNNLYLDLFGAIIPTTISIICIFYLLNNEVIKIRRFLVNIFFLTLITRLFLTSYDGAVIILWLNVILLSSLISSISIIKKYHIVNNYLSYSHSINIFLLAYCTSTFSILLIDISFALVSLWSYIGSAGIVDAIFLSSFFTIIPSFFWISFYNLFKERIPNRIFSL